MVNGLAVNYRRIGFGQLLGEDFLDHLVDELNDWDGLLQLSLFCKKLKNARNTRVDVIGMIFCSAAFSAVNSEKSVT